MKIKKRLFIVFEGPEGSGKTTQAKLLYNHLKKKYDVVLTREPGGTQIAEKIRKIILSTKTKISPLTELLLYEASRAQHISEVILPNLNEHKIVISDRYADASIVYQGYARGLGIELVNKLNDIVVGNLVPDITFILDIEPKEGLRRVKTRRGSFDRLEKENLEFHKKIRDGYLKLAENKKNYFVINVNSKTQKEIHFMILEILKRNFNI